MRAHGAAHNAAPIVAQEIWPEPVMRASKNAASTADNSSGTPQ